MKSKFTRFTVEDTVEVQVEQIFMDLIILLRKMSSWFHLIIDLESLVSLALTIHSWKCQAMLD